MYYLKHLKKIATGGILTLVTMPATLLAQTTTTTTSTGCSSSACAGNSLADLLGYLLSLMTKFLIPIIFAIGIIAFFWGIIQYVINGDNESKRKEGRDFIIWGFAALFVMFAVWGIIALLSNTFGIGIGGTLGVPQFGT
jgi:hypothetical protein